MPVKPGLNPPQWALAGNYTTGPFIGLPRRVPIPAGVANEGHRPGSNFPTTAEEWNDWLAMVGDLIRWVFAGTPAPLTDTRIVETDIDGAMYAQAGEFVSSSDPARPSLLARSQAVAQVALQVDSTLVDSFGVVIDAEGNAIFARSLDAGYASSCILGLHTGTGPAVQGTSAGGVGVLGQSGGVGPGVQGEGAASADGVVGLGAADPSSRGVYGLSDHDTSSGVVGQTNATAKAAANGVLGLGEADGTAVGALAADGYGVVSATNGNLSPVRISPNATEVTTIIDGDLAYRTDREQYRVSMDGEARALWATPGGNVEGGGQFVGGSITIITNTVVAGVTLTGGNAPRQAGTFIHIMVTACTEYGGGAPVPYQYNIFDLTAGGVIWTSPLMVPHAGENGSVRSISRLYRYAVPAAGARTLQLRGSTVPAGNNHDCLDASITVIGTFQS